MVMVKTMTNISEGPYVEMDKNLCSVALSMSLIIYKFSYLDQWSFQFN